MKQLKKIKKMIGFSLLSLSLLIYSPIFANDLIKPTFLEDYPKIEENGEIFLKWHLVPEAKFYQLYLEGDLIASTTEDFLSIPLPNTAGKFLFWLTANQPELQGSPAPFQLIVTLNAKNISYQVKKLTPEQYFVFNQQVVLGQKPEISYIPMTNSTKAQEIDLSDLVKSIRAEDMGIEVAKYEQPAVVYLWHHRYKEYEKVFEMLQSLAAEFHNKIVVFSAKSRYKPIGKGKVIIPTESKIIFFKEGQPVGSIEYPQDLEAIQMGVKTLLLKK